MLLVRTTRSEIEDRQETPKSLSAEPYSQCIFCLGFSSEVKEARIFHFLEFDMVDALRIVIELKKVKADGLKVRQDNQALIVVPSSITPWMMFSRARWLKHQFFLMLDIAKLRSFQYQDADNTISDPTDLAAKLPFNLILIM